MPEVYVKSSDGGLVLWPAVETLDGSRMIELVGPVCEGLSQEGLVDAIRPVV